MSCSSNHSKEQGLPVTVDVARNVPTIVFQKLPFENFFFQTSVVFLIGGIKGSDVRI